MKRALPRFRIKTLLIATSLIAVACAMLAAWRTIAHEQRGLVTKQEELGAAVNYALKPESMTAKAAEVVGVDMVASPKELFVNTPPGAPVDIEGIVAIKSLEHLAFCATGLQDADLPYLKHLPKLKFLNLSSTDITNRGIEYLTNLRLISLHLEQTRISDAAAASLAKIETLRYLCVDEGAMSDSALQKIRSTLPDCTIKETKPVRSNSKVYTPDD